MAKDAATEAALDLGAAEQGRRIGAGKLCPVALAEAYLDRIAGHAEAGRIYVRTTPERAKAEAEAARARAMGGRRLAPLDGVALSWKDLVDTAGTPTEGGSRLLEGRTPQRDAEVLRRASAAGTVCLGKTHLSELAFSGLGINPMAATSPNPHGEGLAPGGSSSGAAASLSFGLAAGAIGSDTGGSVRIPAAWHGLVGLKTTKGLLPDDGTLPLVPALDTIGPLARTVEDAALMLGVLEGKAAASPRPMPLAGRHFIVETGTFLADLDEPVARAFEDALSRLSAEGARITERVLPAAAHGLEAAWIVGVEAWATWGDTIEAHPGAMYPMIRARFETGLGHDAVRYARAKAALERTRGAWLAETAEADAVLAPTTAGTAPGVALLEGDDQAYVAANLRALRNTRIGNMLGIAALTLPTATPMAGLMLMGPPLSESRLLALGAAVEPLIAVR